MTKRAIFILGMHRSGTSALTGVLARLGVAMPVNMLDAGTHNSRGFFESRRINELSDEILAAGGSTWFDWRPFRLGAEAQEAARTRIEVLLVDEFLAAPLIGIKDPRHCRMASLWLSGAERAGYQPSIVISYRHPQEVMQSLGARDGMRPAKALLLWLRHVIDAEKSTRPYPRSIIGMSNLLGDWRASLERVSRDLQLNLDLTANTVDIDAFLNKELRHHRSQDDLFDTEALLQGWARAAFFALQGLESDRDSAEHMTKLDMLADKIAEASLIFEPAMMELENSINDFVVLSNRLETRIRLLESRS